MHQPADSFGLCDTGHVAEGEVCPMKSKWLYQSNILTKLEPGCPSETSSQETHLLPLHRCREPSC
eukprot:3103328-Karenia_brevis.AAC.2